MRVYFLQFFEYFLDMFINLRFLTWCRVWKLTHVTTLTPNHLGLFNFSVTTDAGEMQLVHAAFGVKSFLSPVLIEEHAVFLPCAPGGGGALVMECPRKGRFREDADSSLICLWHTSAQLWLWVTDSLECSLGMICLLVETQSLVFGGKKLLSVWGLCIYLALLCRAKQGSLSRHVLSDAVVGGSHFVNRS